MTLHILFETYGFDPRNRDWWPIFTSINGTAREWLVVSEDWRFRGGHARSNMWKIIERPMSAYTAPQRTMYQQTRATVESTAAGLGIAIPPPTQAAPIALPTAPVAASALPAASIPVASSSSTVPAATMPAGASSSALPDIPSSNTSSAAAALAPTSSSTAPVATGSSSHFYAFIGKLHAWDKLPIVHTRQVDMAGVIPDVRVRNADRTKKLPNELFVMDGSRFAAPVNRVCFSDQQTMENEEVDVVFCSSCVACGTAVQPRVALPIVHDSDIGMVQISGATFEPKIPSRTLTAFHSDDNYQMVVTFSGGKRVLVEVVA
jgi:hypothetical protein